MIWQIYNLKNKVNIYYSLIRLSKISEFIERRIFYWYYVNQNFKNNLKIFYFNTKMLKGKFTL